MFLTSNCFGTFDGVFKSRIHLAIKYPQLSAERLSRLPAPPVVSWDRSTDMGVQAMKEFERDFANDAKDVIQESRAHSSVSFLLLF